MSDKATDLEIAKKLVENAGSFTGLGGGVQQMRPRIAKVVAEGIALGREQGRKDALQLAIAYLTKLRDG